MAVKYTLFLFFFLFVLKPLIQAQTDTVLPQATSVPDTSLHKKPGKPKKAALLLHASADSVKLKKNNLQQNQVIAIPVAGSAYIRVLKQNSGFNFFGHPETRIIEKRNVPGKEALFYLLSGLVLFFALIRTLFNKYVSNLMGLVFRGSLKQKQIREQLLQTPLPSLLMNIFFIISGGLYILFILQHYQLAGATNFWVLLLGCIMALGAVYLTKFLVLKFTGWIFNMREAADTYIFIVFLVNKLLGIFLVPVLVLLAFSFSSIGGVLITISYVMIFCFFAYRYLISFAPVRREVKVSQFHFFMYLCAFEIIPLLLIYKVLLRFL